ncbi:hypothetical protein QYF36_011403 [Acer negundo]|nr:hypothetical protein QYF36_011403 [Acer negundo]
MVEMKTWCREEDGKGKWNTSCGCCVVVSAADIAVIPTADLVQPNLPIILFPLLEAVYSNRSSSLQEEVVASPSIDVSSQFLI